MPQHVEMNQNVVPVPSYDCIGGMVREFPLGGQGLVLMAIVSAHNGQPAEAKTEIGPVGYCLQVSLGRA